MAPIEIVLIIVSVVIICSGAVYLVQKHKTDVATQTATPSITPTLTVSSSPIVSNPPTARPTQKPIAIKTAIPVPTSTPAQWVRVGMPDITSPNHILWSASRPLAWTDFQAPVPDISEDGNFVITSRYNYAFSYSVLCERPQGTLYSCRVRIEDIKVYAEFNKSESWVRDFIRTGERSVSALQYSQTHFDLLAYYAQKAQANVAVMKGLEATGTDIIQSHAEGMATRILSKGIEELLVSTDNQWANAEALYSYQTDDGKDASALAAWTARVNSLVGK